MRSRCAGRREIVKRVLDLDRRGALGQSWLFVGPEGSGKEATALEIARLLECADPDACAETPACESCRKVVAHQHPDVRWICPAPSAINDAEIGELLARKREDPFHQPDFAASSEVLIGDPDHPGSFTIRALLQFLRVRPFQGSRKIAVIGDAHRLRAGAANAFLKMLEEPPPDALIILLTSQRGGLLPTILSRCQVLSFEPYEDAELSALLADLYDLPEAEARAFARSAAGNARRAAAGRLPASRALRAWSAQILRGLDAGRPGTVQVAAEQLHKGQVPDSLAEAAEAAAGGRARIPQAKDLVEKRNRAIRLCETLHLYYSDILGRAARGDDWEPRLPEDADLVRDLATRRTPAGLLLDIDAVERARTGLDRNLNIGLVMSVLFRELNDAFETDRTATGARSRS